MKIDLETLVGVARLANLELSQEQIVGLQRDLDAILGYVAKLEELDTSEVEPTTHVLDIATPLRGDVVRGVLTPAEAVRNAPEHTDNSMVVPKVLE